MNLPHSSPDFDSSFRARIDSWIDDDPDETTVATARALLARIDDSSLALHARQEALAELQAAFGSWLTFGTAGLRAALGAGPNRMNSAVVIRAASAVGDFLLSRRPTAGVGAVVVGFDARHKSAQFAADTCAILSGQAIPVMVLPQPLPTPVLAFAVRAFDAAAGIMVTASHNPAADNGYKVYLGARSGLTYEGSQLLPPDDVQIAERFRNISSVAHLPRGDDWLTLNDDVVADYIQACVANLQPTTSRELRVVHTAMHGVGSQCFLTAAAAAGFGDVRSVAAQAQPDPDFPTVEFPNPEEPGALDLACAQAEQVTADLVIAHDPDADRCAVAVRESGIWQRVSGDDIGLLLGWWRIEQHRRGWRELKAHAIFASSIVSGSALALLCARHGIRHVRTLTGFKWLAQVPGLAYAYEEALGYCVDPDTVRDKDGISAALAVMECAADLKARGIGLRQQIEALRRELAAPVTAQIAIAAHEQAALRERLRQLVLAAPDRLGDVAVTAVDDMAAGLEWDGQRLPPTEGIQLRLADSSRVIIRPSGTEPKVKAYLECPDKHTLAMVASAVQRLLQDAQA